MHMLLRRTVWFLPGRKARKTGFLIMWLIWTASSEFVTYRLCEQQRFRRACASAQSRQNLRCSLIQAVSQEEPSDRKPDPWPLWMAGHAQLKFVMTECSKTQIRLMGLICHLVWMHKYMVKPDFLNLSLIMRKPVFGVCDQGRLKPVCAATEVR